MYTLARYTVYTKLPSPIYKSIYQLNECQGLNCARLHVDSLHLLFSTTKVFYDFCCSSVDSGRNFASHCLTV